MNFGQAIEALKQGKKVTREGWNGKGMYLWLKPATTIKAEWCKDPMLKEIVDANGGEAEALGTICTKTADNKILTGWLASQTDVLAEDWSIIEDIEPKFKVGDRIKHRLTGDVYKILYILSNGCGGGVYDVAVTNEIGKSIDIKEQDSYELLPTKFDITTLKPFDKMLVRIDKNWWADWFSHIDSYKNICCIRVGAVSVVIPYEGNEHLLGTTNDCDDYYKTWE